MAAGCRLRRRDGDEALRSALGRGADLARRRCGIARKIAEIDRSAARRGRKIRPARSNFLGLSPPASTTCSPSAVKHGLTAQWEICRHAEAAGATCVPHSPLFRSGYLATLHILARQAEGGRAGALLLRPSATCRTAGAHRSRTASCRSGRAGPRPRSGRGLAARLSHLGKAWNKAALKIREASMSVERKEVGPRMSQVVIPRQHGLSRRRRGTEYGRQERHRSDQGHLGHHRRLPEAGWHRQVESSCRPTSGLPT